MDDTPDQIGPYPIEAEIVRGGMGVVYRARDLKLDRSVAIKVLPEEVAADPERVERTGRLIADRADGSSQPASQ